LVDFYHGEIGLDTDLSCVLVLSMFINSAFTELEWITDLNWHSTLDGPGLFESRPDRDVG